jgi:hypothetical protein
MISKQPYLEENKRIRRLQFLVDLTLQYLRQINSIDFIEGIILLQKIRKYSNFNFPGKEDVFNMIYKPRILRVLKERKILKFSKN